MEEPLITETDVQPEVNESVSSQDKGDDILSRVSSFMANNKPAEPVEEDFHFDANEIDTIEDESSRNFVKKAHKSLEKAYQRKFQDLAEIRKSLENQVKPNNEWTAQEIQKLIETDQKFLLALQQLAGLDQQAEESDEYSSLSEAERAKFESLVREVSELRNQAQQDKERQYRDWESQQHKMLSERYEDYNPKEIDQFKADIQSGKVVANNEFVYKILNYEKNIKNAYQMGIDDERSGNSGKMKLTSLDGQNAMSAPSRLEKQENEDSKSFWKRITDEVLSNTNKKKQVIN